jgi:hypothetical protein
MNQKKDVLLFPQENNHLQNQTVYQPIGMLIIPHINPKLV